jgi:predicted dehydrogenase
MLGAPVYGSVSELLEASDVDAVIVATPDFAHREPTVQALEAGKDVLVEKPLATSLEDAYAMATAAARSGKFLMTLFNHRWIGPCWAAHRAIASGQLGEPRVAYARKSDRISVPMEMIRWAADTTCAHFLSSHDIDLVLWYLGHEPVEVYAAATWGVLRSRGIETPDTIQAQVRFAEGSVATFDSSWIYPNTYPTLVDSFVSVVCSEGVVQIDRKAEQLEVATPGAYEFPRSWIFSNPTAPIGAGPAAIQHFVDCVADRREPLIDLTSSLQVTRVLAAVARSVSEGGVVAVEPDRLSQGT